MSEDFAQQSRKSTFLQVKVVGNDLVLQQRIRVEGVQAQLRHYYSEWKDASESLSATECSLRESVSRLRSGDLLPR